ncbi:helix-turn-helix domain-containing protein [Chengkuizengella axinellae]|uniref:Helix-turn-helix domain-containing protein n=1 Tax=Chengkuizengella axinellae TaxID=3064388 RepID=A0ABT9J3Y0_9BACL|nr:helix-turn-helix domain-containing protein [Chengkuizengella sp. 2205SS18-9]MDP5276273.1 helix-turn-helix domain-containing protein [Chengkuizengella sp. 2205SS18-9]
MKKKIHHCVNHYMEVMIREEYQKKIIRMYNNGQPIGKIAKKFHLSDEAVLEVVERKKQI